MCNKRLVIYHYAITIQTGSYHLVNIFIRNGDSDGTCEILEAQSEPLTGLLMRNWNLLELICIVSSII